MKTQLTLLFLLCATLLSAQTITRGPYLQSPGPTSIIVHWRTDSAMDSRVQYGTTPGSTDHTVDDGAISTEHIVKLTGLSPYTKYYYRVGATALALRGDSLLYFTTAPDPAVPTPLRFWAMGDFGHGNNGQRLVRESYLDWARANGAANLWLWLGDNVYDDGTEQEYDTKVFDSIYGFKHVFPNLPFASTSGNHDYNSICPWEPGLCNQDPSTHTGPYFDIIDPPTQGELGGVASGHKLFYSFDYGDIHFIVLNSELGSLTAQYNWLGVLNNDTAFTSPMIEWLKADLAATTKKWKIAMWHQCPYSGQDNLTEASSFQIFCIASREHFNPILERFGVDMVLTGHDHNYQRSYLINGHYGYKASFTPQMMVDSSSGNDQLGEAYVKYTDGPTPNKGTVYVVAGGTSNVNSYSPFDHPAIYYGYACDTCLGSFVFDVDGDRLDGYFISVHEGILDRFTIKKESITGINTPQTNMQQFTVFPNPTNGKLTVNYVLHNQSTVHIDVLNINQKVVASLSPGLRTAGEHEESFDFNKLDNGTYLVRLNCDGQTKIQKFVKVE